MRRFDMWISDRAKAEVLECGLKVLKNEANGGKTYMRVWKPKAKNPYINNMFANAERMEKYLNDAVSAFSSWQEIKARQRQERRNFKHDLKIGSILYSSWGYDQTNVDFFQVVDLKGKRIGLRQLCKITNETGHMSGTTQPVTCSDAFLQSPRYSEPRGEPFWRIPQPERQYNGEDNNSCYVRIDDVVTAWLWDGKPKSCSWYA